MGDIRNWSYLCQGAGNRAKRWASYPLRYLWDVIPLILEFTLILILTTLF